MTHAGGGQTIPDTQKAGAPPARHDGRKVRPRNRTGVGQAKGVTQAKLAHLTMQGGDDERRATDG